MIKQNKGSVATRIGMVTSKLIFPELSTFLVGFAIGQLNLNGTHINKAFNKMVEITKTAYQWQFEKPIIISMIIDSLERTKSYHFSDNQSDKKVQTFLNRLEFLFNQCAVDRNYLSDLWEKQRAVQQVNRQNEQALRKFLQQQKQFLDKEKHIKDLKAKQQQNAIRKLIQEQDKMQRQKRINLQKGDMECQICSVEVQYGDIGPLQCEHIFHRACMFDFIKTKVQSNEIQINCPSDGCGKFISVNYIQQYLDGPILDKYNQFCLNKYVQKNMNDTSWCPTAGCPALFEFDQALDNYKCPSCKKHYCLRCKCEYHYGQTCAQYKITMNYSEQDRKFVQFVRGAKFKQCPKCKFWVQRAAGCSTMACRCGIQFCYDCGGTGCPHGSCTGSGKIKK